MLRNWLEYMPFAFVRWYSLRYCERFTNLSRPSCYSHCVAPFHGVIIMCNIVDGRAVDDLRKTWCYGRDYLR